MEINRRKFITTTIVGSLGATLPLSSYRRAVPVAGSDTLMTDYSRLDQILKQPVFKKGLFSSPVIIETLELLRFKNSFLCRVRSKDGAEGISVGHSGQLRSQYPIFTNLLQPFFINKDSRDLDLLGNF